MDLTPYIDWNRTTLLRLIAVVFGSIGLGDGVRPETLTRSMRLKVLHTLRPAESALRRLIFALATELERNGYVPPQWVKRAAPEGLIVGDGKRAYTPAFRLIDPRKWFWTISTQSRPRAKHMPWISSFDEVRPALPAPSPTPTDDDPMDAALICDRLVALKSGLDDLPKQAKRMLRLKARSERRFIFKHPMRPGLPPGWRQRGRDEIDEVLRESHKLAVRAKQAPDTS